MPAPELSALFQQGFARHQAGALQEAADIYARILAVEPAHFDALHLLGVAHMQTGNMAEAVHLIEQAVALQPAQAPALINLAIIRAAQKDYAAALDCYDRAIAAQPGNAEAHYNRGNTLLEMGEPDEARHSFDQALSLMPQHAAALVSRGTILRDAGEPDAALRDFEAAIAAVPGFVLAHYNRAQALKDLNHIQEAEIAFRQALSLAPTFADAHVGLAEALFLGGKDKEAWQEYEWRWATAGMAAAKRDFAAPQWDGLAAVKDKTVLVHAEQGFGDAIQFSRYVPALMAFGARIIFEVHPELKTLFAAQADFGTIVGAGEPSSPHDLHVPLMNLPRVLKAETGPYLKADESKAAQWGSALRDKARPCVGLAWAGRRTHRNDRNRSLSFYDLAPVTALPLDFVSLQKEMTEADTVNLEAQPHVRALGDDVRNFADTAAVIANLDLVITVDTAVAHLAGAMGKPVWILLPYAPDWRWGLGRDETPWYPSAKLYRQAARGDWASVMARVADDLRRFQGAST